MLKGKRRVYVLTVVISAVGLLFGSAGSALADTNPTTGSGSGTGWEYATADSHGACPGPNPSAGFRLADDTFVMKHASTYVSRNNGNNGIAAQFTGDGARMTITVGAHVISPQGVAPSCPNGNNPLVPSPVTITSATIDGTSGSGTSTQTVHCDSLVTTATREYTRSSSNVTFDFRVLCDITSSQGTVTDVSVRHQVSGTLNPCVDPFTGTPNPECSAANTTSFPDPIGDASGHMVTSFTASGP